MRRSLLARHLPVSYVGISRIDLNGGVALSSPFLSSRNLPLHFRIIHPRRHLHLLSLRRQRCRHLTQPTRRRRPSQNHRSDYKQQWILNYHRRNNTAAAHRIPPSTRSHLRLLIIHPMNSIVSNLPEDDMAVKEAHMLVKEARAR